MTRKRKAAVFLGLLAGLLLVVALLRSQVHSTDPPAVFRATVRDKIGQCYPIEAPAGSSALFCDVKSPATGRSYAVVIVDRSGISIERN